MNVVIKYSGEFFDAKDDLLPVGKDFMDIIVKCEPGYIVTGGGNRIRGRSSNYDRNASDNIGVLSTMMNGFILQEHLNSKKLLAKVFTHFIDFGEYYSPNAAIEAHNAKNWVILAGGLGHVGFVSTDLNAVIKALEVKAKAVIKIIPSGYLYDRDPKLPGAAIIEQISHEEVLQKKLEIMDFAAIALAQEQGLSVIVTDIAGFSKLPNERVGSTIGAWPF